QRYLWCAREASICSQLLKSSDGRPRTCGGARSMTRSLGVLLHDLPAIIAARDTAERGAKRLAPDLLVERGERFWRRVAPRAAQDRGDQFRIEIGQHRPEPARQILGERVIRVQRVLGRAADLVHVARRMPVRALAWQARQDLGMLLAHIEAIE